MYFDGLLNMEPWMQENGLNKFSTIVSKVSSFVGNQVGADNTTGCPKKHGNSVTNWISSLLWISIVIPNFKSHNIIMSARVYFMKKVKDCKVVSIMSPKRWTVKTDKFTLFVYCNFLVLRSTTVCSQNKNKKCKHSRRKS